MGLLNGYPEEFAVWFADFCRALKTANPAIRSITADITEAGWAEGRSFVIEIGYARRTVQVEATPDVIFTEAAAAAGECLRIIGRTWRNL